MTRGLKPGQTHSGSFKKGNHANPSGVSKEVAQARDEARRKAALLSSGAIDRLERVANSPAELDQHVIAATKEILDRGLGKPAQEVKLEIDIPALGRRILAALEQHPEAAEAVIAALKEVDA